MHQIPDTLFVVAGKFRTAIPLAVPVAFPVAFLQKAYPVACLQNYSKTNFVHVAEAAAMANSYSSRTKSPNLKSN